MSVVFDSRTFQTTINVTDIILKELHPITSILLLIKRKKSTFMTFMTVSIVYCNTLFSN